MIKSQGSASSDLRRASLGWYSHVPKSEMLKIPKCFTNLIRHLPRLLRIATSESSSSLQMDPTSHQGTTSMQVFEYPGPRPRRWRAISTLLDLKVISPLSLRSISVFAAVGEKLPKPTIAQVQGRVIAGGLMLIWPLDLIVASENATFTDPVTAFGGNGHEYFVHPWELGARKAKEFLFTGESLTAHQAAALGMVNWVVPEQDLEAATLRVAERIASRPPFAIRMAKSCVNRAQDAQGMQTSIDHAFGLHQLCQAVNVNKFGTLWDPAGPPPQLKLQTSQDLSLPSNGEEVA